MKHIFFLLVILLTCIFFPKITSAHSAGQDPFFKINNVYSSIYPVAITLLSDITLPQDIADKPYLVNSDVTFTIDLPKLPFPEDIVKNMTFSWDFGDGTTGEGAKNNHKYTKIGSYIVKIYAEYMDTNGKVYPRQLLQSTLIHIVPHATYKIPKAIISVDGKKVNDPVVDVKPFAEDEKVTLDASGSESSESPIVSYVWDLNNGTTAKEKKVIHTFTKKQNYYFPFLRITTQDGFIADTYVEVANKKFLGDTNSKPNETKKTFSLPILIGSIIGINAAAIGGFILLQKRKKN